MRAIDGAHIDSVRAGVSDLNTLGDLQVAKAPPSSEQRKLIVESASVPLNLTVAL